jgi:UPF0271 protein
MNLCVDLNADLGEGAGHDTELLALVSSANIATGFHAGDADTMCDAISAARGYDVAVGAHPSFFDRENFGRKELAATPTEVFDAVTYQLGIFQAIANAVGVRPNHVKPHGALYNMAMRDAVLADAIARAAQSVDRSLILFAAGESELARAGERHGLRLAREVFADRNYMPDGSLVARSSPDAFVRDPIEAADRVMRMLRERKVRAINGADIPVTVDTVCVHGANAEAVVFAQKLRERLAREEIMIAATARQP